MKNVCLYAALIFLMVGSGAMWREGDRRDEKVMRKALMIDTTAQHTQHKSSHYYNTYVYFVDEETGLRFGDGISDSLYRQFERDGNEPIKVQWPYSIDKREQTSIGLFYKMFGFIGMCIGWLGIAYVVVTQLLKLRAKK